jgi:NADPH-dependent 2,4-dienoyl-CoA reductase/sulfur reductase-like enzyme
MPDRLVDSAARFRAALSIPVIAAGRIELDSAERYLAAGKFDFLAMGRKLLADVDLPRKLAAGRAEEIIPCIYCYTCISQIYMSGSVRCAVNPETAFELDDKLRPAAVRKRVAVVGGGPAGMEAARRLALRGHEVVLLEQSSRLGGTLQFAAIAYAPNERILDWLKRQIGQSKVQVRLKTEATPELLRTLAVDEVVVATGARRSMPAIPGAEQHHVLSGDDLRRLILGEDLDSLKHKAGWATRLASMAGAVTGASGSPEFIREATRKWLPLGERIVIIGGELVGLELAEFLAQRGRKVTVIDDIQKFGAGLQIVRRWRVLYELDELGVVRLPGAREIRIGVDSITYRNPWDQIRTVGADHVIVAKGASGDLLLAESLRAAGFSVHTAGDCNGVGYIDGAMHSAAQVAAAI